MKMLMIVFLIFTLIVTPQLIIITQSSNEALNRSIDQAYKQPLFPFSLEAIREPFHDVFFDLSIASLGKPDFVCEEMNFRNLQENF